MSLMWIIKTIYSTVLDALFPLSAAEKELFTFTPEQAWSTLPRASQVPITDASSVFAYKDERVAKLIWNIKYKKSKAAVQMGGYALYHTLLGMNLLHSTVIVPIPVSHRRRKERGFNQCELLLEEIRLLDVGKKFEYERNLLIRTQHASRQTLKDRSDRLESAKGIFSVNEEVAVQFKEKMVVIIDDVITTGSTMEEAMGTLRVAGFENVIGMSLAH
jgi:competence protein ComFC